MAATVPVPLVAVVTIAVVRVAACLSAQVQLGHSPRVRPAKSKEPEAPWASCG